MFFISDLSDLRRECITSFRVSDNLLLVTRESSTDRRYAHAAISVGSCIWGIFHRVIFFHAIDFLPVFVLALLKFQTPILLTKMANRCGNVASILQLDEYLGQEYRVFNSAPLASTSFFSSHM